MTTYNNQEELNRDLDSDGNLIKIGTDLKFTFDFKIVGNINARHINARNINARNIDAWNIDAWNIDAWNIDAWNINAWNIDARNINARNISFYAFCIAYVTMRVKSAVGRRKKSFFKCLDQDVTFKE